MLPKLRYKEKKHRRQTLSFAGLNMTDMLSEGELTECIGLSGERAPYLSPRYADRLVHSFDDPHGIFAAGGLLYIADGDGLFSYDGEYVRKSLRGLSLLKSSSFLSAARFVFSRTRSAFSPIAGC